MERDLLKRYLDEGLSLNQIGELVGRDASTVGYWVNKHGLVANGRAKYAPRGGLTREQLEPLVKAGLTIEQIGARVGRSNSTVIHWLRKHGLSTSRNRTENGTAFAAAEAAGSSRTRAHCRRHGVTEFARRPDSGWRCLKCRSEQVSSYRRRVKDILIAEAGGRCRLCGYDTYAGALQFHHLDPATKEFAISRKGVTRALAERRLEAAKCVLLCANCHAEVEGGYSSV
jgi:transposase/5-methylcytosine-specific restriction endonuclease McrA